MLKINYSAIFKSAIRNLKIKKFQVGDTGIEPVTSAMSTLRSSQLS